MRAWEEFLKEQEKDFGKEIVAKWLHPLKIVRFDACNLYLEAADSFKALWFEEHVRYRANTTLFNNNNKPIKVHISVVDIEQNNEKKESKPTYKGKKAAHSKLKSQFSPRFDETDLDLSFKKLIVSKNNLLAFKLLCEACSIDPETREFVPQKKTTLNFNPIYLFGRAGTGKTHLMMAVANSLKQLGKNVLYVRADTFTEHVVNAIRTGEMQLFRKTYRNVDALLIDDIEIFSRKVATQEEFFHTFNTLHVEGKQIILSSNTSPQDLKFIEPRLVSRFEWGIIIPLLMFEKEDLKNILSQKAEKIDFPLNEQVSSFLIETFGSNAKGIVGALEALALRTHLNQEAGKPTPLPLSSDAAKQFLEDLIQEEEKAMLTPGKIIRTVAEFYGIRMDDILSKSQSRECALPRQIAMHLCREELNLPFMKIGDLFSRDHSTVMASVKQILKGIESKNYEISSSVKEIRRLLLK